MDEEDFHVSPSDRGLCHGLSLFETVLAVDGAPCLLTEHVERMKSGFQAMGLEVDLMSEDELRAVMIGLLQKNGLVKGCARVRYAVSFGAGALNDLGGKNVWAWMTAVAVTLDDSGLRVMKAFKGRGLLDGLKTGNYAQNIVTLDRACSSGFDEVLFFDDDGNLSEAAMANVFLIKDGGFITPSLASGCLPGIARRWVLKNAQVECEEGVVSETDVEQAEGIFLTSSVKGPVWVREYQGRQFVMHPLFEEIRRDWDAAMGC